MLDPVQQQPPPGTLSISAALVIRGVWDTILQWDTSDYHHFLEQILEHSHQTFSYLIHIQNPWERERRGANFQADFQVQYLPSTNEMLLVEFTAPSHGIISCVRFCTCGRWHWPLGSAAEREVHTQSNIWMSKLFSALTDRHQTAQFDLCPEPLIATVH